MGWMEHAQLAAQARLAALDAWMDAADALVFEDHSELVWGDIAWPELSPPLGQAYCGCQICRIRETIIGAMSV
jgi:hypothetical protein